MTTTLESRGYVATEDDIRDLASGFLAALSSANGSKLHYLRALIGTTVHELGAPSRQRAIKGSKITDDEVKASHLATLEAVHKRFHAVVHAETKAQLAHLPSTGGKRGDEVAKRCNYARTAMSRIRGWVRAGNDITTLVPAKVKKDDLIVEDRKRRRPSTSRLTTRAESQTKQLFATMKLLAAVDKDAAAAELDSLVKLVAQMSSDLRGPATKDPRIARNEHRLFRADGGVFVSVPSARRTA